MLGIVREDCNGSGYKRCTIVACATFTSPRCTRVTAEALNKLTEAGISSNRNISILAKYIRYLFPEIFKLAMVVQSYTTVVTNSYVNQSGKI